MVGAGRGEGRCDLREEQVPVGLSQAPPARIGVRGPSGWARAPICQIFISYRVSFFFFKPTKYVLVYLGASAELSPGSETCATNCARFPFGQTARGPSIPRCSTGLGVSTEWAALTFSCADTEFL